MIMSQKDKGNNKQEHDMLEMQFVQDVTRNDGEAAVTIQGMYMHWK